MMAPRWSMVVFFSLGVLTACGKEVGRVPFAGEGTSTATVAFEAGDVGFWTDIDIEHDGDAALSYRVELVQGGAVVATADCDPLGHMSVKTGWIETNIGSSHSRRGRGKMGCSANLQKGGPTLVRAKLELAQKPKSLALKKADLVLKQ